MARKTVNLDIELRASTGGSWLDAVIHDFDRFLLDHASAERKASAMAVSFVVQYPDRFALHVPMIRIAREELLHYQQVMVLVHQRQLLWERDQKDPYLQELLAQMSTDRDQRLLDRLVVGAMVEARGVERFAMIGARLAGELGAFYRKLATSEARHARTFLDLAKPYFATTQIETSLNCWLDREAQAMLAVPARAALH